LREWVVRLNHLSRLAWLVAAHASIELNIDPDHTHVFEQNGARVNLGFRLAEKPGHLERAALLAWTQRNWPDHDPFTREVMADILTWAVIGDSTWSDPIADQEVSITERLRYSLIPESAGSYCQFPFRSDRDLGNCEHSTTEKWDDQRSLRPLVSWTIWNFVHELPASEQIEFLRGLMTEHFAALENHSEIDRQIWVQTRVGELLRKWRVPSASTRPELRRVFFREDLMEPLSFDLTVEVTDSSQIARTVDSLKQWMRWTRHRRILFVAGGENRIFPEDVRVDLQPRDIQTRRYVIIACDWPKAKDVMHLKSRLLYAVRVCANNNLPSWPEIMTSQASPNLTNWAVLSSIAANSN
jgi:hypothetical protein